MNKTFFKNVNEIHFSLGNEDTVEKERGSHTFYENVSFKYREYYLL